jgi:hypothetical protein
MHWLALLAIVLFPFIAWGAAADLFAQLNKLSPADGSNAHRRLEKRRRGDALFI